MTKKTVFKGDKFQIFEGSLVPKEYEGTNILIQNHAFLEGTLNDTSDIDQGYAIEVAIDWTHNRDSAEGRFCF